MPGRIAFAVSFLVLAIATPARADYETHPELRAENRCLIDDGNGNLVPFADAGVDAIHCQRLFWDLPPASHAGYRAAAAPFAEDPIPQFPNGLTDRIPPLYVYDSDGDGSADDCSLVGDMDPAVHAEIYGDNPDCGDGIPDAFESVSGGYEAAEVNRSELCPDADEVTWWKPIYLDESGTEVASPEDGDPLMGYGEGAFAEGGAAGQLEGHVHEVACRRGTRVAFGPWQVGTNSKKFDDLADGIIRFENSERLARDMENWPQPGDDGYDPDNEVAPIEWNTGSEFYNHFASHHGTCWNPNNEICNNPDDPWSASDPENCTEGYQDRADGPDYPYRPHDPNDPNSQKPKGPGYAGDQDTRFSNVQRNGQSFRNATQLPGRLSVQFPEGRAVPGLEDQLWKCDHHVVHQLPPGSYGMDTLADYRLQQGGLENISGQRREDADPGELIGGSVGEMIIQYFTEPFFDPSIKPLAIMFEVVIDAVTTWYPPFTWNAHTTVWYAPFDLAIGLMTIHSHHRMVKGTIDVLPSNPPRINSPDPACGGSALVAQTGETPEHLYTNWEWEDARLCEYWKEPDGPVIVRKGQPVQTVCFVNNGVTPEAIKHGLVAGHAVGVMREQGAPIPPEPGSVPTSTWSGALVDSPVGREFLYGTHPPINYRVRYMCGGGPGESFQGPRGIGKTGGVCNPNPAFDPDGDYIDGPYANEEQCGEGGWCNPAPIVFANVGEDEMCIPVFMYWPLDRILNPDGSINEEAMESLQEGNIDEVGLPGRLWRSPSDAGFCDDGADGEGFANPVDDEASVGGGAGSCSAGI